MYQIYALEGLNLLVFLFLLFWFGKRPKGKAKKPGRVRGFYYVLYLVGIALIWALGQNITNALFSWIYQSTFTFLGIRDPYGEARLLAWGICWILEIFWTWFLRRTYQKERQEPLYKKEYLLFLAVPLCSAVFLVSLLLMNEYYGAWNGFGLLIFNVLLLCALNVAVVYFYNLAARGYEAEKKYRLHRQREELLYQHYLKLEESYQESRKVAHDVKNHMQALMKLYEEGEIKKAEQYGREVFHLLNQTSHIWYTDNRMLNIILNEKLSKELLSRVRLELEIEEHSLDQIREVDLTTIFANLLDNATEALSVCRDGELSLRLDVRRKEDFLVIGMTNSKDREEKPKEGHQGLGLLNVRETLKRYDGTCAIEDGEREFQVSLLIPLPEREEERI